MTAHKVQVFFYGLFMDIGLLQQRGLAPSPLQVACLDGYAIDIRERVTVRRNATEQVYGIVTGLTQEEIDTLDADPGVLGVPSRSLSWSRWRMRIRCRRCVTPCRRGLASSGIPLMRSNLWR